MNENELIKVKNQNGELLVSARDLHEFLSIDTKFQDWFKRMLKYGFEECNDYTKIEYEVHSQKRERTYMEVDYALKINMAKEIAMIQRNEKGKQIRKYFIQCEQQLKSQTPQLSAEDRAIVEIIHQVKAGNVPHAVGTVLEYGQEKYDEGYDNGQTDKAMELKPALDYMEIMDEKADGFMLVREAAKIVYTKDKIEVGERKLHAVLRHWGWEFIGRSNTEPSQFAIKNGWLIAQPYTHYDRASDRYYVSYTSYITAKGLSQIAKKLLKMSIEEVNEIYKKDKAKIAKKER